MSAAFVLDGDEIHVAPWEWTCPLPPLNEFKTAETTLLGERVRVLRGYEWTEIEEGNIISGSFIGVGLGFANGWWVLLFFGSEHSTDTLPRVAAMESNAHSSPSLWSVRADVRDDCDADTLLRLVREVMARS